MQPKKEMTLCAWCSNTEFKISDFDLDPCSDTFRHWSGWGLSMEDLVTGRGSPARLRAFLAGLGEEERERRQQAFATMLAAQATCAAFWDWIHEKVLSDPGWRPGRETGLIQRYIRDFQPMRKVAASDLTDNVPQRLREQYASAIAILERWKNVGEGKKEGVH